MIEEKNLKPDRDAFYIRFKFFKIKEFKYLSHLDVLNILSRALLRMGMQLKFSCGFNPKPRITLSSPIPLGVESYGEYCDIELKEDIETEKFVKLINFNLPDLLIVKKARKSLIKPQNLMSQIDLVLYEFKIGKGSTDDFMMIFEDFLQQAQNISIKKSLYSYNISGSSSFKILGYTNIVPGKDNTIYKFNNFLQDLKIIMNKSGFKLNSARKKELYILKDGNLLDPIEILANGYIHKNQ